MAREAKKEKASSAASGPSEVSADPARPFAKRRGLRLVLHVDISAAVILFKGPVLKGLHDVAFFCPS